MRDPINPAGFYPQSFAAELDRLSSLALAAGKDVNDELTLILNYAELSRGLVGAGHPAGPELIAIQHSARRCAETARSLLDSTLRARQAVRYAKLRAAHAHPGNRELLR